ncbi:hypothetical protein HanOQP8_Chr03g0085711 [Helianthus annuus]|nr:hypothetical protein HanOQP8_Chr03g0085711 [Helianthus annuus]
MMPSSGGNPPPPLPPEPNPPDSLDSPNTRRISTRSSSVAKNHKEQSGAVNASVSSLGSSRGVHKPSKGEKGRQPLANLSVNDLVQDGTSINLQEKGASLSTFLPSAKSPTRAPMEVELDDSEAGHVLSAPKSFDAAIKAINQGNITSEPCITPSKSPCTTNLVPSDVPTPSKKLDFEMEENSEEEGWESEEDDDIAEQDPNSATGIPMVVDNQPLNHHRGSSNVAGSGAVDQSIGVNTAVVSDVTGQGMGSMVRIADEGNTDPSNQHDQLHQRNMAGSLNNTTPPVPNVWNSNTKVGHSIADRIRLSQQAAKVKIEYYPPIKTQKEEVECKSPMKTF